MKIKFHAMHATKKYSFFFNRSRLLVCIFISHVVLILNKISVFISCLFHIFQYDLLYIHILACEFLNNFVAILSIQSSIICVISFVVHHKTIVNKIKWIGACFKRISYHFGNWKEKQKIRCKIGTTIEFNDENNCLLPNSSGSFGNSYTCSQVFFECGIQ